MKKFFVSLTALAVVLAGVGYVSAAFTDTANATNNVFQAGTLNLQLSTTASAGNSNIADPAVGWADNTSNVWVSPTNWTPGDTFSRTLWIRDAGTVDVGTLNWAMSGKVSTPGPGGGVMENKVILTNAWYDRNGDGTEEAGEDILPALSTAYAGGGTVTLAQLYTGMSVTPFDLEATNANILPGSVTNASLGGTSGTGKGLHLTWEFDPTADNTYQGSSVTVNFGYTGSSDNP